MNSGCNRRTAAHQDELHRYGAAELERSHRIRAGAASGIPAANRLEETIETIQAGCAPCHSEGTSGRVPGLVFRRATDRCGPYREVRAGRWNTAHAEIG